MPYISIRVAGELTIDQRRQIADEVSETMLKVAGKPKAACYIVFDEVPRTHWAKGENILSDQDAREAAAKS
ncbi:MAG: 4-oxalocrotonate tautomerase family protein [Campylobacterales bacterium]